MSNQAKINELIKKYDLDVLEIEGNSLYISCGRGLSIDESNELGESIKKLTEAADD